jgi:hypothetical protein
MDGAWLQPSKEEFGEFPILLKNENSLDFKIYSKPTSNNRFLSY